MPWGQGVQDAEQVGDGAPAQGKDCRQGQKAKTAMDRPRERRLEGIEDGANRLGKSLVNLFEPSSCDPGFAPALVERYGVVRGVAFERVASRTDRLQWTWQPPCVRSRILNTPLIAPGRLATCELEKWPKSSLATHYY